MERPRLTGSFAYQQGRASLFLLGSQLHCAPAGAASSARAGNDRDEYDHGGIKIGPLGQSFGSPPAGEVFATAPLTTKQVRGKKAAGKLD
jgi:hypothetical protein